MWPSLNEPALYTADEVVTYGELLLVGAETGLLEPLRARARRSLQASAEGREPGRDDVRHEAVAFRRARRLESGEDLRSWLGARQLTTEQWEGHLRRLLTSRATVGQVEVPVDEAALHEALAVDLACDGWWRKVADDVVRYWSAGCLAAGDDGAPPAEKGLAHRAGDDSAPPAEKGLAHPAGGTAPPPAAVERLVNSLARFGPLDPLWCADRLAVLHCRKEALEKARLRLGSERAVAARVADHGADWTELVFDLLRLPTENAANEAIMCSREDHAAPDEIARRSGRELEHVRGRLDRLPPSEAALLSGALPGEALGPLRSDGDHLVLFLKERRPPSAADPATSKLAAAELLTEALERAAAGRCRLVGPL